MKDIYSKSEYDLLFLDNQEVRRNKKEIALEQALDIRKFEIDLYWKRATYFWAFIAATFAGYFSLLESSKDSIKPINEEVTFLLNCLGLVFSICWYLVNRGSKFWQENWEKHVSLLEDDIMGPLYSTVIDKKSCKFLYLHKEYPYSVSKINQLLSLYIVFIWLVLLVKAICSYLIKNHFFRIDSIPIFLLLTVIFIFVLFRWGKSNNKPTKNTLHRPE